MSIPAALQGSCRFCGKVTDPLMEARNIVEQVATEHRVPVDLIYSQNRKAYVVAARACAIRAIRATTSLKLTAIGDLFGRDHTTIIHHLQGNSAREGAAGSERLSRQGKL